MRHHVRLAILLTLFITASAMVCAQTAKPNGYIWERSFEGFYDNEDIYYIVTDASDQLTARWLAINYAPLLGLTDYDPDDPTGDGIGEIYFIANRTQYPVFSTQRGESDYTPIWRVWSVNWEDLGSSYILKSKGDESDPSSVLGAAALGLVELVDTGTFLVAPHVDNAYGECIPQSVAGNWSGPPYRRSSGSWFVRLPVYNVYVQNRQVTVLKTDFMNEDLADEFGGNFAPELDEMDSWVDFAFRWLVDLDAYPPRGVCPYSQWSVYSGSPSPVGWRNRNWDYTPFVWQFTVDRGSDYSNLYRNADIVEMLLLNGRFTLVDEDGEGIINSPRIIIPSSNTIKAWR